MYVTPPFIRQSTTQRKPNKSDRKQKREKLLKTFLPILDVPKTLRAIPKRMECCK
jgi:hypothetical protein